MELLRGGEWCLLADIVPQEDRPFVMGIECTCKARGEGCTPYWSECPRVQTDERLCPTCFCAGRISRLLYDPETDMTHCELCGETQDQADTDRAWLEIAGQWAMSAEQGAVHGMNGYKGGYYGTQRRMEQA